MNKSNMKQNTELLSVAEKTSFQGVQHVCHLDKKQSSSKKITLIWFFYTVHTAFETSSVTTITVNFWASISNILKNCDETEGIIPQNGSSILVTYSTIFYNLIVINYGDSSMTFHFVVCTERHSIILTIQKW